jgi:hypothetical protein
MKGEDTLDGRYVWAVIEAPVQTAVWLRAETPKEKVCGPQYEPSSEQPQSQCNGWI